MKAKRYYRKYKVYTKVTNIFLQIKAIQYGRRRHVEF